MPKLSLEKKHKSLKTWKQKWTEKEATAKACEMKYQSSHKKIQAAYDKLKKWKASDNNGIWAEDIKTCDATTKEMIRQIFNEVLKQDDCTPETWRIICIKMSYKKGNVEEVGNYRPICILPALHKLFSTITNNRFATYRLLEQECQEWSIKMWVATVDFMKAFDSMCHQSLWASLEKCGIESHYMCFLRRLGDQ